VTPLAISSNRIAGTRRIWLQPWAVGQPRDCVIFLDAEIYRERVQAPAIVERLQRQGALPPATFVYLSSHNAAARHADFACNDEFASFLVHDVVPWIERTLGGFSRYYLAGLSLSGLAAAHATWRHPGAFSGSLCQSPSAWWNGEWLSAAIVPRAAPPCRYWLSVGDQELQTGISHPPTGLWQETSQRESVRRLAERLKEVNPVVQLHEFRGDHDPHCWAEELPLALPWLLQSDD
jgi:enterochelin esterase family protein